MSRLTQRRSTTIKYNDLTSQNQECVENLEHTQPINIGTRINRYFNESTNYERIVNEGCIDGVK